MLGTHHIISYTTESMVIDGEGLPNTISSGQALHALQSEIDASATRESVSHQSEYTEGLSGEDSATDLPIGTRSARRTAEGITQTTSEVHYDDTRNSANSAGGSMKDNHE